jgi:hypothetical protein
MNTLKDRKFVFGLFVGVALCFAVFAPMFFMGKDAADSAVAAATSCQAKLADLNSRWTVIGDKPSETVPAAQLLHGLVAIAPGAAFSDGVGAASAPQSRWAVPVKIKPFVYGPANGAQYFYFDPRTRELDGPYVPQRGDIQ